MKLNLGKPINANDRPWTGLASLKNSFRVSLNEVINDNLWYNLIERIRDGIGVSTSAGLCASVYGRLMDNL